ncbi:MAG TPA: PEP-CTERM sorting domain-containing protein, partial [Thioalkalivibrio sp.]|nr:PEP-CTERM sorting domain-containing protein [Thioalkalivibrio sp.]
MIKKLLVAAALGTVMSTGAAYAGPFQIDVGYDFNGDGTTTTSSIDQLGYTFTLATSIYLGDSVVPGTPVIDTNIQSVMNSYGFAPGTYTAVD